MTDPQAACDLLYDTWLSGGGLAALPEPLRPATRAEGYAIQACIERKSAHPLFGWKIAATSEAGQKHIGVDGPLAGRLLRERLLPNGATMALGSNRMRVVECEFALRLGRTLAPRATPYTEDEVAAAVTALHPAIEIPDSRYEIFTQAGAPQLIADNACAHRFVLGDAAPPALWRGLDLAEEKPAAAIAGKERRMGHGKNVLGGPMTALTWLANELSQIGVPLAEGQTVITGTCIVPLPVAAGDTVEMDFGALGQVSVRFS